MTRRKPVMQLASVAPTAPSSIPPNTKPASQGWFWDEDAAMWLHPEYLCWLSLAGMAGVPGNCRRNFARYVAWTSNNEFIDRDRNKPGWYKPISVMYCGEDGNSDRTLTRRHP